MQSMDDPVAFSEIVSDIYIDGTWKQTASSRLEKTDQIILDYIENHSIDRKLHYLELGASNGITTLELSRKIPNLETLDARFYLADKYNHLEKYEKQGCVEYRTSAGTPVLLKLSGFGLRLPRSEHRHAILSNALSSIYLGLKRFRKSMKSAGTVSLLLPEVMNDPTYQVLEFDCLQPELPEDLSFNCIRASNVLNAAYFNELQISNVLSYLHARLDDGGLLVISRNYDEVDQKIETVSVWRNKNNRLVLSEKLNGGTEIDALVENLEVYQPCAA